MMPVTMDCVKEVDQQHEADVAEFLRHIRVSTFFHEDNVEKMKALAEMLGIPKEILSSYLWLQAYLAELCGSFDDLPSLAVVAQQYGVSLEELESYLQEQLDARRYGAEYLEDLQQDAGMFGD